MRFIPPNGRTISGFVPSELAEWVNSFDGSASSKVVAGLTLLRDSLEGGNLRERLELAGLMTELQQLAAALPGALTSSGAPLARTAEAIPAGYPVAVAPGCLVLADGSGSAITFDVHGTEAVVHGLSVNGVTHAGKLSTPEFAVLVSQIPAVILRLAYAPHEKAKLHGGLELSQQGGAIRVRFGDAEVLLDVVAGWQFSAEVSALLAQRLKRSISDRVALEQVLQSSPADQEVAR